MVDVLLIGSIPGGWMGLIVGVFLGGEMIFISVKEAPVLTGGGQLDEALVVNDSRSILVHSWLSLYYTGRSSWLVRPGFLAPLQRS